MATLRMSRDEAQIAGWFYLDRLQQMMRGPEWSADAHAVICQAKTATVLEMELKTLRIVNRCNDIRCWNMFDGIEVTDGD